MSKIYCIIGKSSTGKDTLFKRILEKPPIPLRTIIPYTTRPRRTDEADGVEYYFVSRDTFDEMKSKGEIIEYRCYHTVYGDWFYFTANDGQIQPDKYDYLLIMTLEGYEHLSAYFGEGHVIPIYIEVEDGERLSRALARERQQSSPKYTELCRRFIADDADFSDENIRRLGIKRRYSNMNFEECLSSINAGLRNYKLADTDNKKEQCHSGKVVDYGFTNQSDSADNENRAEGSGADH